MNHGTPDPQDGPTSFAGDHRLSSRDAAAIDQVLASGFDPARLPADDRARRVHGLLGLLDGLPQAGAPDTGSERTDELARYALTETTLAGIDRFERERGTSETPSLASAPPRGILARIGEPLRFAAAILIVVALGLWASAWSNGPADGPAATGSTVMAGVVQIPMTSAEAREASAAEQAVDVPAVAGKQGVVARGTLWEIRRPEGETQVWFVVEGASVPTSLIRRGARLVGPCDVRFVSRTEVGPSGAAGAPSEASSGAG
ncbi:MAG: hypothetical protein AB8G96_06010 [Phycisphaerales bacterium]